VAAKQRLLRATPIERGKSCSGDRNLLTALLFRKFPTGRPWDTMGLAREACKKYFPVKSIFTLRRQCSGQSVCWSRVADSVA
jgi:hypothetical protein